MSRMVMSIDSHDADLYRIASIFEKSSHLADATCSRSFFPLKPVVVVCVPRSLSLFCMPCLLLCFLKQ